MNYLIKMILLWQTLGLFSVMYILSSLPFKCKAALDSEKISMKNIQDDHDSFYLKPSRKVLGVGNSDTFQMNSSSYDTNKNWFWFTLIVVIILVYFLVKCCRAANAPDEENTRITVHPPPRIQPYSQSSTSSSSETRSHTSSRLAIQSFISSRSAIGSHTSSRSPAPLHTSSRTFTSPQTSSRSLILLPEAGTDHTLYFAIENPNFDLYTINLNASDQINPQRSNALPRNLPPSNPALIISSHTNSPTQLQDLPPAYETVVAANQQNDNRLSVDLQNSEKMLPPKYEDLQS